MPIPKENVTDRQTHMEQPIRCSLLTLENEEHLKMDLQEKEYEGMDWIHLTQDRYLWWVLVNMVTNLWVS
jgi:hypothetical protein